MLPEKFKNKAKCLLGKDYDKFISALEDGEAVRGVRVNLCKTSVDALCKKSELGLRPLSYSDNGFILDSDIKIGNTPEHHSGMIYVQDPGAMATLCALDIMPGWWVADLCAAPGGKSSQIAERLTGDGFLLSNEYVPSRAKIIVSNFERLGIKNATVTSLDTSELARMYKNTFDLVLADAPCSGEGMFRKSEEALAEWSEENVLLCSRRQLDILNNSAGMVKTGGYLLYSTCTYSIEENEQVVAEFLASHTDFELTDVKPELKAVTADGITPVGYNNVGFDRCRRFYPHMSPGEGQFLALMKRCAGDSKKPTIVYTERLAPLSKAEQAAISSFFSEALVSPPSGRLVKVGNNPVLITHGCPIPPKSVFMPGILLGEIKGSILRPSHQFFSAFGNDFKLKADLKRGDKRLDAYLAGEEIDTEITDKGWCAVLYEGVPLGGGKISEGRVKNHYPKGLRVK